MLRGTCEHETVTNDMTFENDEVYERVSEEEDDISDMSEIQSVDVTCDSKRDHEIYKTEVSITVHELMLDFLYMR